MGICNRVPTGPKDNQQYLAMDVEKAAACEV